LAKHGITPKNLEGRQSQKQQEEQKGEEKGRRFKGQLNPSTTTNPTTNWKG
jgi:hypothetical protein